MELFIGPLITLVLAAIGGAISFGKLKADNLGLEKRVSKVEGELETLRSDISNRLTQLEVTMAAINAKLDLLLKDKHLN